MRLSEREHARLARELIEACGGPDEASRAAGISKPSLSRYSQPHYDQVMPADVIDALEEHCGRKIYSKAMFENGGVLDAVGNLRDLACAFAEQATDVQELVRKALTDQQLTPREFAIIAKAEAEATNALDLLRGARRAAEAAPAS